MIRTQRQRRSRRNECGSVRHARARFDQDQAEGLAEALAEAFHEQIATKADLQAAVKDLHGELMLLEQRLTIKMGTVAVAAIGVLLALEKLERT